ncbi:hypothetical protein ACFFUP_04310 [Vibrio ostreicida]|uniref:Molecular chaperone n=1 Tax=Vibrio ostreicida TaxID=526588 RepID=A0ABT8C101_9VIBR|nr:hypothetical protein [Vibrio ostreicida]MDN3612037.1 hypothetical protein [Vibrio ostreicida]NPD08790.1 hypothetical protein [Vibrio ostreicida]
MNINNLNALSIPSPSPDNASLKQDVQVQLATIDKAQSQLDQGDAAIATLDKQPASADMLAMIAAQQKQVVVTMVSGNPEQAIALALAQSIEAYGKQLETIQRWTNGGKDAFEAAIWEMYTAMNGEDLDGIDYENMYQLVLLDVLINADEYGLGGDDDFLEDVGRLLEKIGSGSHTNWDFSPEEIGDIVESTWSTIYGKIQSGDIPESSLAYQAMSDICGGNITPAPPQEFQDQFTSATYNNPQAGGWITDDLDTLSPMTRMVILSNLMGSYPLSQEQVDVILTGTKSEVDQAVKAITGTDKGALEFLFDDCGAWQNSSDPNESLPSGVSQALDYDGTISVSYLESLYTNFPPRELTDEEIEEINRIGDQVKMLQQTLKYWLSICRDEQMAIARNI